MGLYKFEGENDTMNFIFRMILTPFLISDLIFCSFENLKENILTAIFGFIGSFVGLLF